VKPPTSHDIYGNVIEYDHEEILNEHVVIRRISFEHLWNDNGVLRISSKAYKPSTGDGEGVSVDLKHLIEEAGIDPKIFGITSKFKGAVLLNVGDLRQLNLKVGYDPIKPPDPNPYHCQIWGINDKRARVLKSKAVWLVQYPNAEIQ